MILAVRAAREFALARSGLLSARRSRAVRAARVGAGFDGALRRVDDGERGVAVHHLAFAAHLRERMAARLEVGEKRSRKAILDLHARPAAGAAADEHARRLDR